MVVYLGCSQKEVGEKREWLWVNPLPQGNKLNAVWCSDGNYVWAVGWRGTILRKKAENWLEIQWKKAKKTFFRMTEKRSS